MTSVTTEDELIFSLVANIIEFELVAHDILFIESVMEGPTDSFKWFGEGFDGFLRGLPDDCVEYTVYIIDSKLQHGDIRRKLRGVQAAASTLIKELLKGFIWQRESFKLELAQEKGTSFEVM